VRELTLELELANFANGRNLVVDRLTMETDDVIESRQVELQNSEIVMEVGFVLGMT
jgi:hypothetical protein